MERSAHMTLWRLPVLLHKLRLIHCDPLRALISVHRTLGVCEQNCSPIRRLMNAGKRLTPK